MKLRKPPKPFEKPTVWVAEVSFYRPKTLSQIKELIISEMSKSVNYYINEANLDNDIYINYQYRSLLANVKCYPTDDYIKLKEDEYNKEVKEYNEWYEENKEAIEKELEIREQRKKARDLAKKKQLQKEIDKLAAKLQELEGNA